VAKPFDATLNSLIDARLADGVAFLAPRGGLVPGPAEILDTDLSTTVQADKCSASQARPRRSFTSNSKPTRALGIPARPASL